MCISSRVSSHSEVGDRTQYDHLVHLPESGWALWRWIGLRGAGFPVNQVLALATPRCATVAVELLRAEDQAEQARQMALAALQCTLEQAPEQVRAGLHQAILAIKTGALPRSLATQHPIPEVEAWKRVYTQVVAIREEIKQVFIEETAQVSRVIRDLAATDRLREAITWQNRQALHGSVDALLRMPADTNDRSSKRRRREQVVASYLQRYCTKNETIGFFGPVGWARLTRQTQAVHIEPGAKLLATRNVYFEGWCIDALATVVARDEAILPWMAPRRMPLVHVEGTTLYLPLAPPSRLSAAQAAVLQACDGIRSAKEIAADLLRQPALGLRSEQDVYTLLKNLRTMRRIAWALEIPSEGEHPERYLRQALARIGDERLRTSAIDSLNMLEAARHAVMQAAGNSAALDQAFDQLETTFTQLTGMDATRRAGKAYAARTLVYEDCRRDIEITFGPDIVQTLGPPLELLLTSARWLTYAAAEQYYQAFKSLYAELVQKNDSPSINFADFWLWAHPLVSGENKAPAEAIEAELQQRWSDILAIPADQHRVAYTSAELRSRVLAAFAAPGPGWMSARYHSPDIMIAADGYDAITRGDYMFVMGELHVSLNTLGMSVFVSQHPDPADLFRALEADMLGPQVIPVYPKEWPAPTTRTIAALISPRDVRLVFAHDSCGVPPSRALPIGSLLLKNVDDRLVVYTRDQRWQCDLIEVLQEFLTAQVIDRFRIVRPGGHTPRIAFDQLVVVRESWVFTPNELLFPQIESEVERFVAAQRWRHQQGMPRFIFIKTPVEEKPVYVDLDSVIYVDIFTKLVRRTIESQLADALIRVVEMLPTPDQTWLPDTDNHRYTSELRIVAIDPEHPRTK